MKRIPLAGAATAALLTAAVATAPALATTSTKSPSKKKTPTTETLVTKMTCQLKLVTQVPNNDVTVTQGADSGTQFGSAGCAKPLFRGVEEATFEQQDSGDLTGKWQQWFNAGSVYGTYTLTPSDTSPPTTTSFTAQSYTGTVVLTNGTGDFRKATGTGTLSCTTADSAHYTCTEKLKLDQVVPVPVTKTKTKTKK